MARLRIGAHKNTTLGRSAEKSKFGKTAPVGTTTRDARKKI